MVKSSEKMEKLMLKQENLKKDINLNVELDDVNMLKPTSNYTDLWVITLGCESVFTPRFFSTKTQDFTPMFLKSIVEVQFFLKGSK